MPRWEPNAAGRLQEAALTLFEQQGYAGTTAAEIAARAGLSERTFFNHFATKHEVIFGATAELLLRTITRSIVAAPAEASPLDAVMHGLQTAAGNVLDGYQALSARRRQIIDATPELRERDEGKRAGLIDAIATALRERGVDADAAFLTAGAGAVILQAADSRWTRPENDTPLSDLLADTLTSLRGIVEAATALH
ncbi:TetR/AcrR family transcriptional regulator [Kineosporia babensis]|uniref:TetR/AcrR family transcriptional regulator n=1 Tax=Kineosporia babensis TaxID=499548 RepID=A0A9X1NMR1_9ACTN|nr:TetR/AcrR family transcriptional regulator [Kineosporia babensis]MCD5316604.1 TetR/AcrR family transcriptional regulator [Kineosporia babensis]